MKKTTQVKLSQETVRRLARLARLKLPSDRLPQATEQLQTVLQQLDVVDPSAVRDAEPAFIRPVQEE
ncbi:MAG: hypothetical protein HY683_08125 [Chloroflexi bacterium]|nr:hypothetical protein [Chloroflexota bacterium]